MIPIISAQDMHIVYKLNGCLPFTSKTHPVSNCANGTQKFRWKIPFGARAFHFPYDRKKPEKDRKGPGARWKTQQNVNGTQ